MSKIKVITLPSGRAVSIATYVAAWRALKNMPEESLVSGWDQFPTSKRAIMGAIRQGVEDRINRRDPAFQARLDAVDENEFWVLKRLAQTINGTRIIIRPRDVPLRYREDLKHRITWGD